MAFTRQSRTLGSVRRWWRRRRYKGPPDMLFLTQETHHLSPSELAEIGPLFDRLNAAETPGERTRIAELIGERIEDHRLRRSGEDGESN